MREDRYKGYLDPKFKQFLGLQKKGKTPLELAQESAGSSMVGLDLAASAKKFKYVFIDLLQFFAYLLST